MRASTTLCSLGVVATLSPLLAACGSSGAAAADPQSSSSVRSIPALSRVLAASISQPRVIENQVGANGTPGEVERVVIDSRAGYQAISRSARLVNVVEQGHDYLRSSGSCWALLPGTRSVKTDIVFPIQPPRHYTARASGATIFYTLRGGEQITVDARTHLIRSDFSPAFPSGGVPAYHAAYSYPSRVAELPRPAPLCH